MSDSDEEELQVIPERPDPNAGLHPLFWDSIPEGCENDPNWQALEALKNESTLEERAANFKVQGNNKLRIGLKAENKHVLREAVEFYCKGLELKCSDNKLNSILLSNRAHVESLLGNWRKSLQDSIESQKLDADNVKAYFRGAKAALTLGQFEVCRQQCALGQARDSKATQFTSILKEAEQKQAEEDRKEQQLKAKKEAEAAPSCRLADAIISRGIRVCRPQVRLASRFRPELDDAGLLQWPVMIMYPESMQQDSIEAFCEGDTVADHLDVIFGPDAPPMQWDIHHEYTRDKIELFYLSHAGRALSRDQLILAMQGKWPDGVNDTGPQRYGEKAAQWQPVDEKLSLRQLLASPDYVVPGVPLLFAVAKGTEYRKRFLQEIKR